MRPGSPDDFQTPVAALQPVYQYLKPGWTIWEPACGKGRLVDGLRPRGYHVIASDILTGRDFLQTEPPDCDAIVTNGPFSLKNLFLARAYDIGKPFALLLPLTALETAKRQAMFRDNGLEVILLPQRINFETPTGRTGRDSSSWFATAWFTWGLNVGRQLTFV